MADWQSGLCGCFNDCGLCIISFIIPCYTFGKNAEALGESCILCGLLSLFGIPALIIGSMHRAKTRELKGIEGSMLMDVVLTLLCPFCVLVQTAVELRHAPANVYMARE